MGRNRLAHSLEAHSSGLGGPISLVSEGGWQWPSRCGGMTTGQPQSRVKLGRTRLESPVHLHELPSKGKPMVN